MTNPHEKQKNEPAYVPPPSVTQALKRSGLVELNLVNNEVDGEPLVYNPDLVSVHTDDHDESWLMVDSYSALDYVKDEPAGDPDRKAANVPRSLKAVLAWCPEDMTVMSRYGIKIGIKLEHIPEIMKKIKETPAVPEKYIQSFKRRDVPEQPNGLDKPLRLTKAWKGAVLELFDAVLTPPQKDPQEK